jgi:hypothetical protein
LYSRGIEDVQTVLEDGLITTEERQTLAGKSDGCLAEAGYSVERSDSGQLMTVDDLLGRGNTDAFSADISECLKLEGGAGALYDMMARNPENLDESEITAACFVEAGVVPSPFTKEDFDAAMESESPLWQDGDIRAQECLEDPLGLIE